MLHAAARLATIASSGLFSLSSPVCVVMIPNLSSNAGSGGTSCARAMPRQSTTAASLDVDRQVSDTINGLRTTLGSITDAASAQAALPKLQEAVTKIDQVNALRGQLSVAQQKALTSLVNPAMPTLNQLFDKALAVPGASDELKPTVDALRAKFADLSA